ncbi:Gfo/Idh/MocA family protein [Paenibacillus taichungensis]|uniref:Gfo/Idh/MocA family protein n=1 Tax=Paenibacillus taichungensis TaxID=484184 RepID=UPI0039A59A61
MKKIKLALIGAGARGLLSYAPYVLAHSDEAEFVAVAEPDAARRNEAAKQFGLASSQLYESWEHLLAQPKLCDAVLICTQDRMHYGPTMAALDRGYHILLEKPMSNDPLECLKMAEAADQAGLLLTICHVSRYASFWQRLKHLLAGGAIGEIVSIQHNENVGYLHYAHSFVRGNWRNDQLASPMILAKSCHDMDLIRWLIDDECVRLSSFGSLKHFQISEAPEGSTERCTDGCAVEASCPYSAPRFYMQPLEDNGFAALIATPPTETNRMNAILHGPYGRCVYRTDNNVVDHQIVNMEFAGGSTVMFSMCGFTRDINRIVQIMGTGGEIRGDLLKEEIDLFEFSSGKRSIITTSAGAAGHQGGDEGIMSRFLADLREGNHSGTLTSAQASLDSHLMAFAAEASRLRQGLVVEMSEFKATILASSACN